MQKNSADWELLQLQERVKELKDHNETLQKEINIAGQREQDLKETHRNIYAAGSNAHQSRPSRSQGIKKHGGISGNIWKAVNRILAFFHPF